MSFYLQPSCPGPRAITHSSPPHPSSILPPCRRTLSPLSTYTPPSSPPPPPFSSISSPFLPLLPVQGASLVLPRRVGQAMAF